MQNVHYSPPQLAPLFGVNVSTIKRWVDKGFIGAEITSGGHRRISQKSLRDFVRAYPKYAKKSYVLKKIVGQEKGNAQIQWKRYYDLLAKNNEQEATQLIERLYLTHQSILKIMEQLVAPTLRHIGQQWEIGAIEVFDEHRMSFLIRGHLASLSQYVQSGKRKKHVLKAVLACAPGEHHELPLVMTSLVLQERGIETTILGINIPSKQIIASAESQHANCIVISKTFAKTKKNFLTELGHFSRKKKIPIFLGGNGWQQVLQKQKDVHVLGSLSDLVERLKKL